MHSPKEAHFEIVYEILRYLKKVHQQRFVLQENENKEIEVFIEADWVGSIEDRKFTTGYYTFVFEVAKSSTEVEFKVVTQGIYETLWLKKLLNEFHVVMKSPANFIVIIK